MKPLHLVGLCGSLRANSLNRMALRLAGASVPAGTTFEIVEWDDIPPFNNDVLTSRGIPEAVAKLGDKLHAADGIVIASPEYNASLPGMFKNTLDWLSRLERQPLLQKPVAILSAATGQLGGARMQYELRRSLLSHNAMTLVKPEVFISLAQTKFSAEGECIDETTRKFVSDQMLALRDLILFAQRARA